MKQRVYRVQATHPLPRLVALDTARIVIPAHLRTTPDPEELNTLTESIRRHGLLQPIAVRKRKTKPITYELLFGYRRLLACKALFLPKIPCLLFPEGRAAAVLSLCENLQRKTAGRELLLETALRLGQAAEVLAERLPCREEQKPPKERSLSLFLEEETPEAPPQTRGVVRDVRLVTNSIDRAVGAAREAGLCVEMQKIDRKQEIFYHIRLPKNGASLLFSKELQKRSA